MRFHIGNVIEKIRSDRGMNQADLAYKARIRPNTLGDLENRRKNSRLETLEAVAEALGHSVGELYCELDQALKANREKSEIQAGGSCPDGDPEHEKFHAMLEYVLHGDDRKCLNAVVAVLEAASDDYPGNKGGHSVIRERDLARVADNEGSHHSSGDERKHGPYDAASPTGSHSSREERRHGPVDTTRLPVPGVSNVEFKKPVPKRKRK
jgi:transcriptional regulator with XRE-family HTH domain